MLQGRPGRGRTVRASTVTGHQSHRGAKAGSEMFIKPSRWPPSEGTSPGGDSSGLGVAASSRVEPPRDSAGLRLCWWQGWAAEGRQGGKGGRAERTGPGQGRLKGPYSHQPRRGIWDSRPRGLFEQTFPAPAPSRLPQGPELLGFADSLTLDQSVTFSLCASLSPKQK